MASKAPLVHPALMHKVKFGLRSADARVTLSLRATDRNQPAAQLRLAAGAQS